MATLTNISSPGLFLSVITASINAVKIVESCQRQNSNPPAFDIC
jgi:hypothetical protein